MKGWFWGAFLVLFGLMILMRNVFDIEIRFWDTVMPILFILWGISMLMKNLGKKKVQSTLGGPDTKQ
jgi:predicted membrane protein